MPTSAAVTAMRTAPQPVKSPRVRRISSIRSSMRRHGIGEPVEKGRLDPELDDRSEALELTGSLGLPGEPCEAVGGVGVTPADR